MELTLLLQAAGAVGLFSARAFVPAFLAAVFIRFGDQIPVIEGTALIEAIGDAPAWFTHDVTLLVLGVLSALEILAQHSPEARELYDRVSGYLKSGMAIATTLGVATAADIDFIEGATQQAGFADTALAVAVGASVYGLSTLRSMTLAPLAEADEDDALGLQGLWAWVEDIWASFGVILVIVFPLVVAVMTLGIVGVLLLLRRRARVKEERAKTPCPSCQTPAPIHASACPNCRAAVPAPRSVGFFGQPREAADPQPDDHDLALLEKRRCSVCAARLEQRRPVQRCETCGETAFESETQRQRYLDRIAGRVGPVVAVAAAVGWVPGLGLIVGVIVYKLRLVSPLSRYVPRGRSFVRRLLLRGVLLVLGLLQFVPLVGVVTVPAMALLSYGVYRRALEKTLAESNSAD